MSHCLVRIKLIHNYCASQLVILLVGDVVSLIAALYKEFLMILIGGNIIVLKLKTLDTDDIMITTLS